MLQCDLPSESSQFGTLRPTKLDKIKNLSHQIPGGGVIGRSPANTGEQPSPRRHSGGFSVRGVRRQLERADGTQRPISPPRPAPRHRAAPCGSRPWARRRCTWGCQRPRPACAAAASRRCARSPGPRGTPVPRPAPAGGRSSEPARRLSKAGNSISYSVGVRCTGRPATLTARPA